MSTAALETRRGWSDRLNPIVVKEVRQAMRGRYFRVLFWITLTCAVVIGLAVLASESSAHERERAGQPFFLAIFGVLAAAVHAFVPFSAYLSASAELDENTWDLLVISNLRPRQIVAGKLVSALVQALLFYSAFGPFLVFAFLLNGVDLLSIAVILPGSLITCAALSLVGIALSSLSRVRFLRILLMAFFGGVLVFATGMTIGLSVALLEFPNMLRDPDALLGIAGYATAALLVGGLAFAVAVARFAHEEENRSSALRLMCAAIVVIAGLWSSWAIGASGNVEALWACQFAAAMLIFIPLTLIATEEDPLRRALRKRVPRNALAAFIAAPFLPGGGRGMLLIAVLASLALLSVPCALLANSLSLTADDWFETIAAVAVTWGYVALHIGLIGGIGAYFARTPGARLGLRWTILASVPFAILLPGLLGLFFDIESWMELEHPLNPIYVLSRISRSNQFTARLAYALLTLATFAAIVVNFLRVIDGVREALSASRARRVSS